MNSVQIFERCCSKELITSFNGSGLCISYQKTNFSPGEFTVVAFDTFSHADKNSLYVKYCSHNTAITLFQSILNKMPRRPKKYD